MFAPMTLPRFDLAVPTAVAEAARLLGEGGGEALALAGGTDLLVKMKRRVVLPRLVVALRRVTELEGCAVAPDGSLRVGARCTMSELGGRTDLPGAWAALREGAAVVGGPLIRNRATVAGNVLSARPCADTLPPLVALGARASLVAATTQRLVDVDGFVKGPGETAIRNEEILTHFEIAPPKLRAGSCYLKAARRQAMEVTVAGCAAYVVLADDGETVTTARLVYSSVAPLPLRSLDAEREIEAGPASPERISRAASAAARSVRPIDDHRGTAEYRRTVVEALTRRALETALSRARGERSQARGTQRSTP